MCWRSPPVPGGGSGGSADLDAHGEITIWYSNNDAEIAWGSQMVDAWNADHPDEKITAQEIPAGASSEETIGAAIAAGNAPCLVFNTSPAAVPQFQKQGGLVDLSDFEDGDDYITERSGDLAEQYRSEDGDFYQLPWKSNPVMIFYNKTLFAQAGLDPENPSLSTYDEFLATARTLSDAGVAPHAINPAPTSEFFQPWFDFYPLYAAQSGGTQLVEDGKATFDDENGKAVADFWHTLYDEGLAGNETYQGDAFADAYAAMAIVGPWAIQVYGDDVDWGVVPVPTQDGTPALAVLHRPMWDLGETRPGQGVRLPAGITDDRQSIWISYIPLEAVRADIANLVLWEQHRFVAGPEFPFEAVKIGGGPPPLRVPEGWLVLHHGVTGVIDNAFEQQQKVNYAAGALLLDADDPSRVIARTPEPLLAPETDDERSGIVPNVVFPTAIEEIDGRYFVFYGMADSKIGVAELERTD